MMRLLLMVVLKCGWMMGPVSAVDLLWSGGVTRQVGVNATQERPGNAVVRFTNTGTLPTAIVITRGGATTYNATNSMNGNGWWTFDGNGGYGSGTVNSTSFTVQPGASVDYIATYRVRLQFAGTPTGDFMGYQETQKSGVIKFYMRITVDGVVATNDIQFDSTGTIAVTGSAFNWGTYTQIITLAPTTGGSTPGANIGQFNLATASLKAGSHFVKLEILNVNGAWETAYSASFIGTSAITEAKLSNASGILNKKQYRWKVDGEIIGGGTTPEWDGTTEGDPPVPDYRFLVERQHVGVEPPAKVAVTPPPNPTPYDPSTTAPKNSNDMTNHDIYAVNRKVLSDIFNNPGSFGTTGGTTTFTPSDGTGTDYSGDASAGSAIGKKMEDTANLGLATSIWSVLSMPTAGSKLTHQIASVEGVAIWLPNIADPYPYVRTILLLILIWTAYNRGQSIVRGAFAEGGK